MRSSARLAIRRLLVTTWLASTALATLARAADPARLAETHSAAVAKLNEQHRKSPERVGEEDLARMLPQSATAALEALLREPGSRSLGTALVAAGESALDLDRIDDFQEILERARSVAPDAAERLGIAISRPRFLARGLDGVEPAGLEAIADALDLVLDGYAETFAFREWSTVPGKKLRLRAHLVPKITKPPHFAPQFPFHSEIDFPVVDPQGFTSPTAQGQFLLSGLCHELGHVIAMWGNTSNQEDHHAWAHYTGVVVVEHLAETRKDELAKLRDARWRSLSIERKTAADEKRQPSRKARDGMMTLYLALNDLVGPEAVGAAINDLDARGDCKRVNGVRYYALDDFLKALGGTAAGKERGKDLAALVRELD